MSERVSRRIRREDRVTTGIGPRQIETERVSRRIRRRTISAGEVVTLTPEDGQRHAVLTVKAPSGALFVLPLTSLSYELWVPEDGTWVYRWDEGDQHELVVSPAPIVVERAADITTPLPPMNVERRPRF